MKKNVFLNKKNIGIIIRKAKHELRKQLLKNGLLKSYKFSKKLKSHKALRFYLNIFAHTRKNTVWIFAYKNIPAWVGLMVARGRKIFDDNL